MHIIISCFCQHCFIRFQNTLPMISIIAICIGEPNTLFLASSSESQKTFTWMKQSLFFTFNISGLKSWVNTLCFISDYYMVRSASNFVEIILASFSIHDFWEDTMTYQWLDYFSYCLKSVLVLSMRVYSSNGLWCRFLCVNRKEIWVKSLTSFGVSFILASLALRMLILFWKEWRRRRYLSNGIYCTRYIYDQPIYILEFVMSIERKNDVLDAKINYRTEWDYILKCYLSYERNSW